MVSPILAERETIRNELSRLKMANARAGIISIGVWGNMAALVNNTVERLGVSYRICTVRHHFYIPIWRDWAMG